MFGWILVSIVAFRKLEPADAVIIIVVGGVLFLPMFSFELPIIPEYDKGSAIAWSLLLGESLGGTKRYHPLRFTRLDWPMILWCLVSPIATSLTNGLGLYNGLSNIAQNFLQWGVIYWMGRRYFGSPGSLRKLSLALVVGGLLYFPLIVFEVRMSPQLSRIVYGFFPHSFLQHVRYGGFRPLVFMQHGLMVALWAAVSAVSAYWLWRSRAVSNVRGIPTSLITLAMIVGTILCKSAGAIVLMTFGIILFSYYKKTKSTFFFRLALFAPAIYIVFRIWNILPVSTIEMFLARYFDPERVQSALMRMTEEDVFGARARLHPLFGWGGYQRGWPIDPEGGGLLVGMIDALWIILFNTYGGLGLVSAFLSLGIGPWMVFRKYKERSHDKKKRGIMPGEIDGVLLSLVLIIYLFDCLLNAMQNPVYILCAGALVSYSISPVEVMENDPPFNP